MTKPEFWENAHKECVEHCQELIRKNDELKRRGQELEGRLAIYMPQPVEDVDEYYEDEEEPK